MSETKMPWDQYAAANQHLPKWTAITEWMKPKVGPSFLAEMQGSNIEVAWDFQNLIHQAVQFGAEQAAVEVIAVIDGIPGAIRVREGAGPENVCASLAVSVEALKKQLARTKVRSISCCFCHAPCESLTALKEHSATCKEHPAVQQVLLAQSYVEINSRLIVDLRAELAAANAEVERLKEACDIFEANSYGCSVLWDALKKIRNSHLSAGDWSVDVAAKALGTVQNYNKPIDYLQTVKQSNAELVEVLEPLFQVLVKSICVGMPVTQEIADLRNLRNKTVKILAKHAEGKAVDQ